MTLIDVTRDHQPQIITLLNAMVPLMNQIMPLLHQVSLTQQTVLQILRDLPQLVGVQIQKALLEYGTDSIAPVLTTIQSSTAQTAQTLGVLKEFQTTEKVWKVHIVSIFKYNFS